MDLFYGFVFIGNLFFEPYLFYFEIAYSYSTSCSPFLLTNPLNSLSNSWLVFTNCHYMHIELCAYMYIPQYTLICLHSVTSMYVFGTQHFESYFHFFCLKVFFFFLHTNYKTRYASIGNTSKKPLHALGINPGPIFSGPTD